MAWLLSWAWSLLTFATGPLLFPLLALAGWWLCFYAPLGRRTIRAKIFIPASRAQIWRWIDPYQSDFSFRPGVERRNARVAAEDPLTVLWESRPAHGDSPFTESAAVFSTLEHERKTVSCISWRDGVEIPVENRFFETITLSDVGDGVNAELTMQGRLHGLINLELHYAVARNYLQSLRKVTCGGDAKQLPLIRFIGWRMLAFGALASMILLSVRHYNSGESTASSYASLIQHTLIGALSLSIIILHELGHALAMIAFGHRGVIVSLIPFFGGIAMSRKIYANKFEAGIIALAGAGACALVGMALLPLIWPLHALSQTMVRDGLRGWQALNGHYISSFAFAVLIVSVMINLLNLLPFSNLDGGKVLSVFTTKKSVRFAILLAGPVVCCYLIDSVFIYPLSVCIVSLVLGDLLSGDLQKLNERRQSAPSLIPCDQIAPASPKQRLILAALTIMTIGALTYQGLAVNSVLAPLMARAAAQEPEKNADASEVTTREPQLGDDLPDEDDAAPTLQEKAGENVGATP